MASYVFTEKAERDIEKIIDYTVGRWGDSQAIQYIESLQEVAQLLADNPEIGMKRDTLSAGLLSFPCQSHLILSNKQSRCEYYQSVAFKYGFY